MRNLIAAAVLAASFSIPSSASAQVSVQLRFDLPVVLPGLIVVEPGIQVVPQVNEEVFFVDGFYWVRRDSHWYRSQDHRRGWVLVDARGVPPRLMRFPPGHYRHWEPSREDRERDRFERERMRERERDRHDREQLRERDKHERERQREQDKRAREDRREDRKDDRKDDRRDRKD